MVKIIGQSLLCFVLLASVPIVLAAAPPKAIQLKVEGNTVTVVKSFPVTVTAPEGADFYIWQYPDSFKASSLDSVLTVTGAPNGTYKVSVVSVTINIEQDDKGKIKKTVVKDKGEVSIVIGSAPGPDPQPDPGPDPKPIPVGDKRVLLVYESTQNLTRAQINVLYSPKVTEWLNSNTKEGKEGWRRWDKDVNTEHETDLFKQLWSDAKPNLGTLPVIVLVNGTKGRVYPLPENEASALELLSKWASGKMEPKKMNKKEMK